MQQFRPQPSFQDKSEIDVAGTVDADRLVKETQAEALTLLAALHSTMAARTTGQVVVIPGSKKRYKSDKIDNNTNAARHRRMNPRLRLGLIYSMIFSALLYTLFSLSPLAAGQGGFPGLSAFGNWIRQDALNLAIVSHIAPVQQQPVSTGNQTPPAVHLPKSQYIAIAQQDAIDAGISPDYFVRQINQESGFNPNAVSPAGAIGIAQFEPGTASGLGINPWDPIQALRAAAQLMARYAKMYGGNYAMALAAYNGGTGTVQYAVNTCGSANWLNCLPAETRHYIYVIMGI
jgi:soluble lytic murein transglycosylase-like protein